MAYIREPCALRPAPFALRPAPFALRPSPFALRPSPFALRPSPFALRPSPFALRPAPCAAADLCGSIESVGKTPSQAPTGQELRKVQLAMRVTAGPDWAVQVHVSPWSASCAETTLGEHRHWITSVRLHFLHLLWQIPEGYRKVHTLSGANAGPYLDNAFCLSVLNSSAGNPLNFELFPPLLTECWTIRRLWLNFQQITVS